MLIQDMDVFKKAHQLTLKLYKITQKFQKHERYSLVNQIRRAVYSVPMNLVEGSAQNSLNSLIRYLNISIGSITEVNYQIFFAKDLQNNITNHCLV